MPHSAGHVRGGVAEVDRDDVRGEPELRIEHGLQHDERVAVEREVVGDEQREEADDRGDDVAQAELRRSIRRRAPAARTAQPMKMAVEYKIRHRRPAGDVNAGNERERVQDEREPQQPDRCAAQRLRPADPREDAEHERDDVQHGRVVERAELVEEDFEVDLRLRAGFPIWQRRPSQADSRRLGLTARSSSKGCDTRPVAC